MRGYAWPDAYLRTASKAYSTKDLADKFAHLNNDAVQNKGEDYGKSAGQPRGRGTGGGRRY